MDGAVFLSALHRLFAAQVCGCIRHYKQKHPGGLGQSACVSYSDVEAGFAKDIIPAGNNILRAAFNNFHDSR